MAATLQTTAGRSAEPRLAIRLALFYGAYFLVVGCYMPYLPVWLKARGLSASEIALVLTTPLVGRVFFTPLISFAVDRLGHRRLFLIVLAWGALLTVGVLQLASGFHQLLMAMLIFSLFWTSITPLSETVAMTGVRAIGMDYGRVRLWGSLTFVLASFGGGLALGRYGPEATYWIMFASAGAVVGAAYLLPRPAARAAFEDVGELTRIRARDAIALLRSPSFLLFLFATSAGQASHAIYYGFGTIHWQSLGISPSVIGALWSIGVIAEIMLFAASGRIIRAVGPGRLIGIGAIGGIVRWTALAFDPPLALLFPVQALHGLTFGAAHLAAMHFIGEAAPEGRAATAQGLYAAVVAGIALGGMMAAAGPLYTAWHGHAFLAMAALSAASGVAALLLMRRWKGGPVGLERRFQPQSAEFAGATRQPS